MYVQSLGCITDHTSVDALYDSFNLIKKQKRQTFVAHVLEAAG